MRPRPKLSDQAHEMRGLQPERDGRVRGRAWSGRSEFLWFLGVMPIHQTISVLLGKRGDERLAAVGTWCCRADSIGTPAMLHPNLRPRDWASGGRTQLLHRHCGALIGDEATNAGSIRI